METIENNNDKLIIKAAISDTLANSIRRYVNEVPVLAIDEVEIVQNGSALYDETLAHRIGLVPFKTDKKLKEDSVVKFTLKKKGPGTVYSGDIKGDIEVAYGEIPLTILKENQEINIKATAKLGKGSYHAKHNPGFLFYRHSAEITTDKSLIEEIKSACPDNDIKEKGDKIIIIDDKAKDACDVIEGIAEHNKKEIETKLGDLILTIESFGQMDSKDILKGAIDALKKDLTALAKKF